MPTGKYYDILLIGSFGMGKSIAGNKLLDIDPQSISFTPDLGDETIPFFVTNGGGPTSTTQFCKLLPKASSGVRVMDTPGFSGSHGREFSNYEANLNTFRKILLSQRDNDIAFSRVLYFLPQRGPLHRADGRLQEEIKIMYHFYNKAIFNVMVIIATNHQDSRYQIEFSEEDMKFTEDAFVTAFKSITGDNLPKCPPILYLPIDETDLLSRVKDAPVLHDTPLHLETRDERSAKGSIMLPYTSARSEEVLIGSESDHDVTQRIVPIDESKPHPDFICIAAKIVGGILTLGIPLLIGKCLGITCWPIIQLCVPQFILGSRCWPIVLTLCVPLFICKCLGKSCWSIITAPLHLLQAAWEKILSWIY